MQRDLVLVEAETVAEAVAQQPGRRTTIKRGRVVAGRTAAAPESRSTSADRDPADGTLGRRPPRRTALPDRGRRGRVRRRADRLRRPGFPGRGGASGTIMASPCSGPGFIDLDALADLDTTCSASTISRPGRRAASGRGPMSSAGRTRCIRPRNSRSRSATPSRSCSGTASRPRCRSPRCSIASGARRWRSSRPRPKRPRSWACGSISARPTAPAAWSSRTDGTIAPVFDEERGLAGLDGRIRFCRGMGGPPRRPGAHHAGARPHRDLHAGAAAPHRRCRARPWRAGPPALLPEPDGIRPGAEAARHEPAGMARQPWLPLASAPCCRTAPLSPAAGISAGRVARWAGVFTGWPFWYNRTNEHSRS